MVAVVGGRRGESEPAGAQQASVRDQQVQGSLRKDKGSNRHRGSRCGPQERVLPFTEMEHEG